MRFQTVALIALATATLAACGGGGSNGQDAGASLGPVVTSPTSPPTVAGFAVSETKTHTCSTLNPAALPPDMGSIPLTDSEAAVDVESVTPACNGGPAS